MVYAYDYMGRRAVAQKRVLHESITTCDLYRPISETRFIYDGWNVIQEHEVTYASFDFQDPITSESYSLPLSYWGTGLGDSLGGV